MTESYLVLPDWLISSPMNLPVQGWGIRVFGDTITDLAPHEDLYQRYPTDRVWAAPGQVLAPGFVDSHTHLYGVLAHGIPLEQAPEGFLPFLEEFWWPKVENKLDQGMICVATDLQCAQMLLSGITSFYDCTEAPFALPGCLQAQAEIVNRHGLRAILSFEATQRISHENGEAGLLENTAFIDDCRKDSGLVTGMMCFHTTFTCSAEFIQRAFEQAAQRGVLTHFHCCEGTYEPEHSHSRFGVEPLVYYDQLGVLGMGALASQCVQITQAEIELMAERGARASHMPLSNCEVGGGIAPLPEMVQAGIIVGLGSDGYITDIFEVMRAAFLIHKASHHDPRVMPANLVWYLATEGGARALGLDKTGKLATGFQADFVLIEPHLPTRLAAHNLYDQLLLYCHASDVQATVVAGVPQVKNGVLIHAVIEELQERTIMAADRLWSTLQD